jgi:hypothetical protein
VVRKERLGNAGFKGRTDKVMGRQTVWEVKNDRDRCKTRGKKWGRQQGG